VVAVQDQKLQNQYLLWKEEELHKDRKKENKRYQLDSSRKQYRDRKKQKKQASGTSGG
jgi:hypothetical protein